MPRDLLKVRLNEIPDRGLDVHFAPQDQRYAQMLAEVADGDGATGEARVRLELWPSRVDLSGSMSSRLPQHCSRCLEPFDLSIEREFTQVLMRTAAPEPELAADGELELNLRDLDKTQLVGDVVDLGEILREELLLALPPKMLCREDCQGICPGCGAELNSEPCTCQPETDPRWDILKQLKLDS